MSCVGWWTNATDSIDLVNVGSPITWNTVSQPTLNFSVQIQSGGVSPTGAIFNGYDIALYIVPVGTTVGTINLPGSTYTNPSSGTSVLGLTSWQNGSPGIGTLGGGVELISNLSSNATNVSVPATPVSLFNIALLPGAGPTPSGTFELFAQGLNSDFINGALNSFSYANAPGTGGSPDALLGTFDINPTPEPASLLLASVASAGLFAHGWRKRRRPPSSTRSTDRAAVKSISS